VPKNHLQTRPSKVKQFDLSSNHSGSKEARRDLLARLLLAARSDDAMVWIWGWEVVKLKLWYAGGRGKFHLGLRCCLRRAAFLELLHVFGHDQVPHTW
jgi:hypothetical protein